jgi:hypothetical protein
MDHRSASHNRCHIIVRYDSDQEALCPQTRKPAVLIVAHVACVPLGAPYDDDTGVRRSERVDAVDGDDR